VLTVAARPVAELAAWEAGFADVASVLAVLTVAVVAMEAAAVAADCGVTGEPVGATAWVTAVGAEVAACAWRENTSRTARIPAASSAACTARRAMRRRVGWGTSGSRSVGRGRTRMQLPSRLPTQTRVVRLFCYSPF